MRFSRKIVVRLAAMVSVTALAVATVPAAAHAAPATPGQDGKVRSAAEALATQKGGDVGEAQAQLNREARATALSHDLTTTLGDKRTAGTWIDDGGTLHVAVVDDTAARAVELNGAVAEHVTYSKQDLAEVTTALDTAADRGQADGVRSWSIDPKSNRVVVAVLDSELDGTAADILDRAEKSGKVRVEGAKGTMKLAADVHGGQEYTVNDQWRCSTGFNAVDSSGTNIMITAGHCTEGATSFDYNGASLGTLYDSSFPGTDFGAVELADSMSPSPLVDMYDGYGVEVEGSEAAPVGATLCKSGRTTGWTCGEVVSLDNSVNYGDGDVVNGLAEHDACVEQGDSGGANMSGNQAQGLSSGGALYESEDGLVCGEKVGEENVSYFQPISDALDEYGAELVTA